MSTRRILLLRLAAVPALAATPSLARACEALIRAAATRHEVEIAVFQFRPARLEIRAGDSVRWTNRDGIEHSATARDTGADGRPIFDTGLFGKDQACERTFARPGTFPYFCTRHPSMRAVIVVRA
ncbi:MAG: hypothetical protein Kow0058_13630 [Roseovarius sp.]